VRAFAVILLAIGLVGALARPRNLPAWLFPVVAAIVAVAVGVIHRSQVHDALRPLAARRRWSTSIRLRWRSNRCWSHRSRAVCSSCRTSRISSRRRSCRCIFRIRAGVTTGGPAVDGRTLAIGLGAVALFLALLLGGDPFGLPAWVAALVTEVVLIGFTRRVPWRQIPIGTAALAAALAVLAAGVADRWPSRVSGPEARVVSRPASSPPTCSTICPRCWSVSGTSRLRRGCGPCCWA
jgi:hypothetical protein